MREGILVDLTEKQRNEQYDTIFSNKHIIDSWNDKEELYSRSPSFNVMIYLNVIATSDNLYLNVAHKWRNCSLF